MTGAPDRAILALAAAPGTSSRAVPLLGLLGLHAEIVSWHRRGEVVPDAILATSVASLEGLTPAPSVPVAVWVQHHDQIDRATQAGATTILTAQADLVPRGAVLVPRFGIEVDRWPAVAPLVRRRWRERLGFDEVHVMRVEGGVEPGVGEDELKVAAVVVVSGPATLLALALGAPVVTSADTARRLGLRPGRDAEVAASPDAAMALALEIAADDRRATALSRRGRRCAELHLDLGRPSRVIAGRLGLTAARCAHDPRALLDERLDELGTQQAAPIRRRAADALAVDLAHGGGSSA